MTFESKTTHESQVHAGVRFTIRRLNVIQRAKRDSPLLQQRTRLTEIEQRIGEMTPGPKEGTDPHQIERARLQAEAKDLEDLYFRPAYIKAGLISIEGCDVDGKPMNAEAVIDSAPDGLITEIYIACIDASGLSPTEMGNLPSPSTSPEPEVGSASNTSADPASTTATTISATAAATFPAT